MHCISRHCLQHAALDPTPSCVLLTLVATHYQDIVASYKYYDNTQCTLPAITAACYTAATCALRNECSALCHTAQTAMLLGQQMARQWAGAGHAAQHRTIMYIHAMQNPSQRMMHVDIWTQQQRVRPSRPHWASATALTQASKSHFERRDCYCCDADTSPPPHSLTL